MIYLVRNNELFEHEKFSTSTVKDCIDYLMQFDEIQVDTETEGFDPHVNNLICFQLGTRDRQYVIDYSYSGIEPFREMLETKLLILHNAKFDLRFFYHQDIFPPRIYDTFLAECVLTTGLNTRELSLKGVAKKYCNVELDKDIRGVIHREGLSTRVIEYSASDVKYLSDIKEQQLVEIERHGLQNVLELENEVVKVFARMEYTGVLLDADKWMEIAQETSNSVLNISNELDDIVREEPLLAKYKPAYVQGNLFGFEERDLSINWSSPKQKLDIVNSLGLNLNSVDEKNLARNKTKHRLIPKLMEYSKQLKLSTSFGKDFLKFINKKTRRIHLNIWQILKTGRISVSDPNLNQIPARGELGQKMRSCFIPKEGYKIVGGDFSGMELRIIAEFSKDPLWVEAFNNDEDLHSVLCSKTFNIPIEDVKKEPPFKKGTTYRDIQKTVNFGLAYGMSKHKLSDTMQISVEQADEIINRFFKVVPKVKEFLDLLGETGKRKGRIKTPPPYSRIRWFEDWERAIRYDDSDSFKILGEIERASKNTPIQGCNGDIIKLALINVQKYIDENKLPINIILSVYDEIQTECKSDYAEQWKIQLDRIMIESAEEVIKSVPIKVDSKISDCWSK